jgi:hypothetical protein
MSTPTNARLWELAQELDEYVRDNDVTDWELNFISDMHAMMLTKRAYYGKQPENIMRLWEKYCI